MRKGKKFFQVVGALLLALFLTTGLVPVYGDELDKLRQQQKKATEEIKKYQNLINTKNKELKSLSQQLRDLDSSIATVEKELEKLEDQLSTTQTKLAQTQQELNIAEAELAERSEIFSQRLVAIYQNGDVDLLEVLFSSTSITDFLVRFELLSRIAEQDMELLKAIEAQKAQIEQHKAELEERRQELAGLKSRAETKRAELAAQRKAKEELRVQIATEKEAAEKALAEQEKTSQEIAQRIKAIQAQRQKQQNTQTASRNLGGRFAWPVPGYSRITSDYGTRVHPVLKVKKLHTGVDVGAPSGAKVVAAEAGTVIIAGWFGAYGNTVVVDHGNNTSTLYGHLSAVSVKVGEQVTRGQQVGKVGSTGLSTGSHLHFEVRINGDPTNPWDYLK